MGVVSAVRFVRVLWAMANDRERSGLLVIAWLHTLTLMSILATSGMDWIVKACWLFSLAVVTWSQIGAVVERGMQTMLTEEFLQRLPSLPGTSGVVFEHAGVDYRFASKHGWVNAARG